MIEFEHNTFFIPASLGDALDRVTILRLKIAKSKGQKQKDFLEWQLKYIVDEIMRYRDGENFLNGPLTQELSDINQQLWNTENIMRKDKTIDAALQICELNGIRINIKNRINLAFSPETTEEKVYE